MKLKFKRDRVKLDRDNFYYRDKEGYRVFSYNPQNLLNPLEKIFFEDIYNFNVKKDNPVIIDCGANIGLGLLYWKKKFPKCKIVAFEPSKKVYDSLKRNIEFNKLDDITLINKAIAGNKGKMQFTTNENLSGSLILEKDLPFNYEVDVDILSEYINEEIDFLKIDIEGAEIEVLKEIEDKIHLVRNLFIEYHSFVHKDQELSYIFKLLENNNFRYFVDGEYRINDVLVKPDISLNQDLQIGIWAKRLTR